MPLIEKALVEHLMERAKNALTRLYGGAVADRYARDLALDVLLPVHMGRVAPFERGAVATDKAIKAWFVKQAATTAGGGVRLFNRSEEEHWM